MAVPIELAIEFSHYDLCVLRRMADHDVIVHHGVLSPMLAERAFQKSLLEVTKVAAHRQDSGFPGRPAAHLYPVRARSYSLKDALRLMVSAP